MINLIPNQEKKKMVQHFRARLLIVFLMMVAVTFFIGSISLLPAYFFSSIKKDIANNKLEEQRMAPLPKFDQDALVTVQDLNSKFKLLEAANTNRFVVTERIINEIILKKMPEIKITQIAYSGDNPVDRIVSVRGFAPSRESLLAFRFMLENNTNFKNIDLPISNFIKGTNIQFFLTFKLNPTEKMK
ncbi:MAG: hypothetical protein NTW98_02380 [Candidatus Nomurabacteria bacterium]|nr:hypothetical protein [Candidatus Nomurabacteria bacterium]